jgi:hypothetical protein
MHGWSSADVIRFVCVCVVCDALQVLVGTAKGAEGASIPPEWVREAGWRQDVRELLAKTEGLNSSQKKCVNNFVPCCAVPCWAGSEGLLLLSPSSLK